MQNKRVLKNVVRLSTWLTLVMMAYIVITDAQTLDRVHQAQARTVSPPMITGAPPAARIPRPEDSRYADLAKQNPQPVKVPMRTLSAVPSKMLLLTDYGAVANDGKDDAAAINAAIAAAQYGDVILVPDSVSFLADGVTVDDGQTSDGKGGWNFPTSIPAAKAGFVCNSVLRMKAGVTFKSVNWRRGKITFQTANNVLAVNATNIDHAGMTGLTLRANCGIMDGSGSSFLSLNDNDMRMGYAGSYYFRFFGRFYGSSDINISNNYENNSKDSDRNLDVFNGTRVLCNDNHVHDCHDGGHFDGTNESNEYCRNWGDGFGRMALEFQGNLSPGGHNNKVNDNTFWDWRDTGDTWEFAMSLDPQLDQNFECRRNKMWSGTAQMRYCYEIGARTLVFTDNFGAGNFVTGICSSMVTTYSNCTIYSNGTTNNPSHTREWWGPFVGEGGLEGMGVMIDGGGNLYDAVVAHAPAPTTQGGITPPPPPPNNPTWTFTANPTVDGEFTISFGSLTTGVHTLSASFNAGTIDLGSVTLLAGTGSATLTGSPRNWVIDCHPTADGVTGAVATIHTTDTSGAVDWPWPSTSKLSIKTAPPPPPPADDPVISVSPTGGYVVTHKSGKTETVAGK